ncbi:DUF2837 family protein [Thalassolituus sp. ST750PaO-4]|uniref:lipid II flippase family protein n=1 Tax=Thalassolituus sp. ST750PaO-4 TaxID=2742965 RepID=UPI001CE2F627|nr:DUF2837 family protein [Thalassolituus sp. ST750PaO-4]MCA6058337.1 DUF2837 family protein [Thalassolituus sp. ST750PaO-4]
MNPYFKFEFLFYAIPVAFAGIHFFEFSSYYARVAGLRTSSILLGYSYQQMCFVVTRFFYIGLMPLLGIVVDSNIRLDLYKELVHLSLLSAGFFYAVAYFFRGGIVKFFERRLGAPVVFDTAYRKFSFCGFLNNKKIVFLSCVVFCVYSIGVFASFYYALQFYEYRVTISQLSGVINGFATVLLTFIVEPALARRIDTKDQDSINTIYYIMIGRFIGVAIVSHFVFLFI